VTHGARSSRCAFCMLAADLAVSRAAGLQKPALQARFIVNMAVAISDGTTTIISDFPYQSGI